MLHFVKNGTLKMFRNIESHIKWNELPERMTWNKIWVDNCSIQCALQLMTECLRLIDSQLSNFDQKNWIETKYNIIITWQFLRSGKILGCFPPYRKLNIGKEGKQNSFESFKENCQFHLGYLTIELNHLWDFSLQWDTRPEASPLI